MPAWFPCCISVWEEGRLEEGFDIGLAIIILALTCQYVLGIIVFDRKSLTKI